MAHDLDRRQRGGFIERWKESPLSTTVAVAIALTGGTLLARPITIGDVTVRLQMTAPLVSVQYARHQVIVDRNAGAVGGTPAAPVVDAVIISDTSASLTTGAYSGDGSHESTIFEVVPIDSPWTAANGIFDTVTSGDLTVDSVFALDDLKTWKYRATHTNSAGASNPSDSLPLSTNLAFFSDWSANGAAPVDDPDSTTAPGAPLIDTTATAMTDGSKWQTVDDQSTKLPRSGVVSAPELGFPSNMLNALRIGHAGSTDANGDTLFADNKVRHSNETGYLNLDTMAVGWTFFHRLYQRISIKKPPTGCWRDPNNTSNCVGSLTAGGPHFYQGFHELGGEDTGRNCSFVWEWKYAPDTLGRFGFSFHNSDSLGNLDSWSDTLSPYPVDSVMMVEMAFTKTAEHRYIMRIRIDEENVSGPDRMNLPTNPRELDNNCLSSVFIGSNGGGGNWHQGATTNITQRQGDLLYEWPDGPHAERDRIYWGGFATAFRPDSTSWIGPYGPGGQD